MTGQKTLNFKICYPKCGSTHVKQAIHETLFNQCQILNTYSLQHVNILQVHWKENKYMNYHEL